MERVRYDKSRIVLKIFKSAPATFNFVRLRVAPYIQWLNLKLLYLAQKTVFLEKNAHVTLSLTR